MLHRAAGLRAAGYSDDDIRRLLRSGVLTPVRRGAYVESPPDDGDAGHALLVRAALAELGPGAVASHVSAAAVHGLPTWGLPLERAHVTFDRRTGGRLDARLHVHTAPLHPDDIVVVDGLAVTSWARTVVDIARRAQFDAAVAGAARRVVAFADGLAESVGESRSRIAITRAGLPPPVLQLPVTLAGSTAYADFGWPAQRTLGEFDGKVKYGRLLKPGQEAGDALYAEKLREDEFRFRS